MKMTGLAGQIVIPGERRNAMRREIDQDAFTLVDGASSAIACNVLDISDTGARIEFKITSVIPKRFKLWIAENHLLAECERVWRKGNQMGLRFRSSTFIE